MNTGSEPAAVWPSCAGVQVSSDGAAPHSSFALASAYGHGRRTILSRQVQPHATTTAKDHELEETPLQNHSQPHAHMGAQQRTAGAQHAQVDLESLNMLALRLKGVTGTRWCLRRS